MAIVIEDYVINVKHKPVLYRLKPIDYYKELPDLFLETYTDLDDDSIDEIISNQELCDVVLSEVYKNLTVDDEKRFIKVTNSSLEMLNSFDGVIIVFLERYYNYNSLELIKMSSEELLSLFIFNLKARDPQYTINIDNLREILSSFYSEKTVNDFIDNCCGRLKEQAQKDFDKEFEQLNNI